VTGIDSAAPGAAESTRRATRGGPSAQQRRPGPAFASDAKLRDLHKDWQRFSTTELLIPPGEQIEPPETSLLDVGNVERQAIEFWQPTLELLR
jgi:hypothetical protein